MRKILLLTSALLVTACSEAPQTGAPIPPPLDGEGQAGEVPADSLAGILEDHWALRLSESPTLAEQLGASGRGQLSDPTLEGYFEGIETRRALLNRLGTIAAAGLTPGDRLNHALLTEELQDEIEAAAHKGRYFTITPYSAPHLSLARLADQANLRTREDMESYLARLEGMAGYMDGVIARLGEGVEQGWTQPC